MDSPVRFGIFEVDLGSRELRKRGIRLHLPDQSFEILAMLVERPGDVISRDEIRDRLWPNGTVVEFEHSVSSAVQRLRDRLGDSATAPRFIETLPRRGYRFVASVQTGTSAPSSPHFRILDELGQGGMGVVYRAEDLILGRTVALKFLPEDLARHPPSVERFRREARALASLNHPGICVLYGVEEHEGRLCLVMEYLEGQPLSRLKEGGPLTLKEALNIAVQASEAIAAAHAVGIVHRDITPANIFVTGGGQVKILDFGLAEATRQDAVRDGTSPKAAVSEGNRTASAGVDGTTAYLSPEQIRGEPADVRSDIFSLGLVLYEMLTGTHPFRKESPTRTQSAILREEPNPFGVIGQKIPPDLRNLIERCLCKDAGRRIQRMDELNLALNNLKGGLDSGRLGPTPTAAAGPSTHTRLVIGAAAVVVLAATAWYWLARQRPAGPEAAPHAVPLTTYPGDERTPTFSPDGQQVAFQWCTEGASDNCDIYIKQIGEEPPFRLTSDPAVDSNPAWSPDGRFIAFLRELSADRRGLMLVPQRGGRERLLDELNVTAWRGLPTRGPYLCWTPDSKWLVVPSAKPGKGAPGLLLLSVETQEERRLTTAPAGSFDTMLAFSPDGRTLAFTRAWGGRKAIWLSRLGKKYEPQGEPERVALSEDLDKRDNLGAAWTPGGRDIVFWSGDYGDHLISWSGGGLWRMSASVPRNPVKLAFGSDLPSMPAISRLGNRLVYAYDVQKGDADIYRADLSGQDSIAGIPYKFLSSTRDEVRPAFSPDGSKTAFYSSRSGTWEIWVCDRDGSNAVQLTSLGGVDWDGATWSPDGRRIAFGLFTGGKISLFVVNASGGIPQTLTSDPSGAMFHPSWSRDGQSVYFRSGRGGQSDIWKMPAGGGQAVQVTRKTADLPQVSPDGRFLYFHRTDRYPKECTVWRMPLGGGEETLVLAAAACFPAYMVHERGIYFFTPRDKQGRQDLSLLDINTGKTRKLLTIEQPGAMYAAVSPDGRTILYTASSQRTRQDLMLVENFR
jgi:Tol biopolymer transport system component/DNA-binding winged helix-turn-helix (wHTH) protein